MKQLWIFRVSGGEPFQIQVEGNPPMNYDGRPEAILRTLCTEDQAMALEAEMLTHGCTVEASSPSETPDQKTRRQNIMQALGGDRVFPCPQCPSCAWFDPEIDSLCGAGFSHAGPGWEDVAVEGAMKNERYAADFAACPLREGQTQ